MIPEQLLQVMALVYISEQLEQSTLFFLAIVLTSQHGDPTGDWNLMATCSAYLFRIGHEAWQKFTKHIGVDGDYLVKGNYQGFSLEHITENLLDLAPSAEEVMCVMRERGRAPDELKTADSLYHSWRQMLGQICPC